MNVSPRQLRMFLAVAECLSFSKAAEQLFVAQPSLSKSIRDLEGMLGLPLFERTTRHVRLTPGGASLATVARTIVGEYEAGLRRMASSAEREARQLAVSSLPSLAGVLLPQMCAALEQRHPALRITVRDCSNSVAVQHLLQYQVDFALASVAPSHADLHYEEILRDRFALLACGDWCGQLQPRMRLDDLIGLPLITMTDASTAMRYISAAYLQRGIEFRPKMQFDQLGTVEAFVRQGLGIAVLPYLAVVHMRGMQLSEIEDGPVRSVGIVTRRAGMASEMAALAMEEARLMSRALMAQHAGWLLPPG